MRNYIKLSIFLAVIIFNFISFADEHKIVAIVNDDVITRKELQDSVKLNKVVSNIQNTTSEELKKITEQTLQLLIDGKLLMQQAKKFEIEVSPQEINKAVADIENRNNMPKGYLSTFFPQNGVDFSVFKNKLQIEIIKKKFNTEILIDSISISESELNKTAIHGSNKDATLNVKKFTTADKSEKSYKLLKDMKNIAYNCKIQPRVKKDFSIENFSIKLSSLPEKEKNSLKTLSEDKFSSIFEDDKTYYAYQICSTKLDLNKNENIMIRNYLASTKLSKEYVKFMDRLKQSSYIKILNE